MGVVPGTVGRSGVCPWLRPEFEEMRIARGYTPERVVARWRRRTVLAMRAGLGKGFKNQYRNQFFFGMGVGNPYSAPRAHILMVRIALRVREQWRSSQ